MPPRLSLRAKPSVKSNAVRISATAKIPTKAAAPVKQAAVSAKPPPRLPKTLSPGTLTPFESELGQEVRTMSHRIDRALEDQARCWALHEYDRDTPLRRSIRIGAAEYRQKVGALAIPTRCRGNPAFSTLDDPSVPREPRRGANALARRWRCGIRAAPGSVAQNARQRRPACFRNGGSSRLRCSSVPPIKSGNSPRTVPISVSVTLAFTA